MTLKPAIAPAMLAMILLAGCGETAKTPTVPYPQRILAAHGVDYRTCFPQTPLADTTAPASQGAAAGGPLEALVAIDASGSMAAQIAGQSKMEVAKASVQAFVQDLPAEARVGLLVFGHAGANTQAAKAASCGAGAQVLLAPTVERGQIATALAGVKPVGWTPLAAAIGSASQSLSGPGAAAKVIYIVSDGLETCGGDPVAQARAANQGAQKIVVNVIAFGVPTAEQARLREVSDAGGGSFLVAEDAQSLRDALRQAREASLRGYFTDTASTRGQNVVAVGGAVSKATYCVKASLDGERSAAMAAIDADETAKRASPDDIAAARSLINNRGGYALKALVAYADALQTAEHAQADVMWKRFRDAQGELRRDP